MRSVYSRRDLLQRLGIGAAAVPLLGITRPGHTATAFPRRLVIFTVASCGPRDKFWPKGTERDFTLPALGEPLADLKNDLIWVGGLIAQNWVDSGNQQHRGGYYTLTGEPSQGKAAGGPSLDQFVAMNLPGAATTQVRSLQLGVNNESADEGGNIVWKGAGGSNQVPNETDPFRVFDKLFSGRATADGKVDPTLEKIRRKRKSVLDYLDGSLASYGRRLATEDRLKLQAHMDAIREIEKQLDPAAGGGKAGGTCQAPQLGVRMTYTTDTIPQYAKTSLDLVAAAIACDVTRIVTIQWQRDGGEAYNFQAPWNHKWIDKTYGSPVPPETQIEDTNGLSQHSLQHGSWKTDVGTNLRVKLERWYVEQFAYLVRKLKAIPEGGGSVLDNTAVLFIAQQGLPSLHCMYPLPCIIAGSCGGAFRTGRWLNLRGPDLNQDETFKPSSNPPLQGRYVPHSRVLTSLAQAVGVNKESFGRYGGALTELAG